MKNRIKERIIILDSFKTMKLKKKTSVKSEDKLKRKVLVSYLIGVFLVVLLFAISAMMILSENADEILWGWSGLLVVLAILFAIRAPFIYINYLLQKHRNRIDLLNEPFDNSINSDLKNIINRLNDKKMRFNIVGIPAILIIGGALLQLMGMNPYWNYFAYVIMIYCLLIIAKIYFDINMVQENFKKFEEEINVF